MNFPTHPLATAMALLTTLPAGAQSGDAVPLALPTIAVEGEQPEPYKPERAASPKYPQPLLDTPQTINVIPESVIEDQGATTLQEVLRNVPGISIQAGEGGTPAGDQLSIRGFSARTDIFIDGVRDFGGYARDPFNLEQVEVVKGPASSYSGRGSTGGAINLVSKTPRAERFTTAELSLGTEQGRRATLDMNQPLGDSAALRLNLMIHEAEVAGRDEVENQRWGLAPSLALDLGAATRLTLSWFHLQQDNLPDYGIPWVPASNAPLAAFADRPAPVDFSNFYGLLDRDYEDVSTDLATVELNHAVSDTLSLRNLLRYGRTDRDSIITAPRFAGTDTTDITRSDWKSRDQVDTILANQTDLTLAFRSGALAHTLVTGLELARETSDNHLRLATGPDSPDTDLFNPNPRDPYLEAIRRTGAKTSADADSVGVYAFDTLEIGERWQLNAGLRWDRFAVDYTDTEGNRFKRTDREWSWRAGVVYKPRPDGSIYAAYGTSFNPSAEGLTLSTRAGSLEDVPPEESRTVELGTKWELLDRRLALGAALFRTEKTNARTDPLLPDDPPVVLEGEQRVDGIELSAAGSLTPNWDLYAGYVWLDSEVTQSNDPTEVGNELGNTPRHTFNLWTTYRLANGLEFGGGAQYVDERFNGVANTRVAPDYTRYDLMLGYRVNDHLSLRLNVYNLTDEDYIANVGGGHFIPGEGRTAWLTATLHSF